jgi:hypothetical protein
MVRALPGKNMSDARVPLMLREMGLSQSDPAPQIAAYIPNVREFKALLLSNDPSKRRAAYDALRPHLAFTVPDYEFLWESARNRKKRLKRRAQMHATALRLLRSVN